MTSKATNPDRPDVYDGLPEVQRPDHRTGGRTQSHPGPARPRWLKLGLAGAVGFVAGSMLFATRAEGRTARLTGPRRQSR